MVQTPSPNPKPFGLDLSNIKKYITDIRRNISKRYLLIEFNNERLIYGEAQIKNDQVYVNKLNSINIGEDAIERGTPINSDLMSSFIKEIILEDNIWAHRVGIVLPPQAAFCKVINLPSSLDSDQARDFVIKKSGFQFPIPLNQSDYDLIPIEGFYPIDKANIQPYFLTSIPRKLTDNIIETLDKAELELSFIDLSFSSLEKLAYESISQLQPNKLILIIELCNECSHFYIYNKFGIIQINTLAAIRSFPDSNDEDINDQISLEEKIINGDEYLPITELDLKILIKEIQSNLSELYNINPMFNIDEILLSGINSSHPNIANIFQEVIGIRTTILRPIKSQFIEQVGLLKPLINQSLSRILGLGLNPLISDPLISNKYNKINKKSFESKSEDLNNSDLGLNIKQPINQITNSNDSNNEINLTNNKISYNKDNKINANPSQTIFNINSTEVIDINNKSEFKDTNISYSDNSNEEISNLKQENLNNLKNSNNQEIDNQSLIKDNQKLSVDQFKFSDTDEKYLIEKGTIETDQNSNIKGLSQAIDFDIDDDNEENKGDKNNIENDLKSNYEDNNKEVDFEMPDS